MLRQAKRSGLVLENRQTSDFANLNLSDLDSDFNKNRNEALFYRLKSLRSRL